MKKTRKALLSSIISLVLCFSMLLGTTYAWFTDSETSTNNIIKSGVLDLEMYWTDNLESGIWKDASEGSIFNYEYWEPGYTDVKYIKIANEGNLAFQYALEIVPNGAVTKLADVIDVYLMENPTVNLTGRGDLSGYVAPLISVINGTTTSSGTLLPKNDTNSGEITLAIAMKMQETAGNEYQTMSLSANANGEPTAFSVRLMATQYTYEADSFDDQYDKEPEWPGMGLPGDGVNVSQDITVENGAVNTEVTLTGGEITATIPAGVAVNEGVSQLTLSVYEKDNSESNVTTGTNEELVALNVHIDGVSEDNTKPIIVALGKVLPVGLNMGNLSLYHVEDDNTNLMEQVDSVDDLTTHNQFYYDPATGNLTVAMATFSEVALVANTEKAWEGNFDYSWYIGRNADYEIANADQLAAFGSIVGGMNGQRQDSFSGKTVKLISDVNLGDKESENNTDLIFYPIGYYNSTGSYEKTSGGSVTSSVNSFEGIFDGAGHTISNFYQNTWEMFGDYNDGYSGTPNHYKDAMGLFGYVVNGTVKNLTVKNFSSDGEYTPTGVIAAYAVNSTFENIAITNCNPRVYNTGNGGIIGIAGNTNGNGKITLKNITVDNSNKISALWGSYDVACGGLVGMFRGNADGGSEKIHFENCHVAAIVDVYNDVCGNYQYYAYRYAGMIIGSVRHNTTNAEGKTIPNMAGISATGCTVNYGNWNDYYYCEFEKNGHPSYSGPDDYKFSRVLNSDIDTSNGKENATCNHNHSDVEDNQAIYLPFHQLFTGYGWGVNSVGLETYGGITVEGGTDIDVSVGDQNESVLKFSCAFPDSTVNEETGVVQTDFLYRVGTLNDLTVGTLFSAINEDEVNVSGVYVSITAQHDDDISMGSFAADSSNWKNGKIRFEKTGIAKVTIQDYDYCTPTVLYLEVVDAKNVYSANIGKDANATANNVVLLENVSSGGFSVSGDNTFYGNGFTVTCAGDGSYSSKLLTQGYVNVSSGGTLENVRIVCDIYPRSYLFTMEMQESNGKYPYARSAIVIEGDCIITNCYVEGARTNIYVKTGNVVIRDTVTKYGSLANIHIDKSSDLYTVTLHNLTTIQEETSSKYDTSAKVLGMGVIVGDNESASNPTIKLTGYLKQYNWVSDDNKDVSNDYAKTALESALQNEKYQHQKDDKTYVNLGIVWLNEKTVNIKDARNSGEAEYVKDTITIRVQGINATGQVYSVAAGQGSVEQGGSYQPGTNLSYEPQFKLSNTTLGSQYVANTEGCDEYCYVDGKTVKVLFENGTQKELDLTNMVTIEKYSGRPLEKSISVKDESGNPVTVSDGKLVLSTKGDYTVTYSVIDKELYDKNGNKIEGEIPYSWNVVVSVSLKDKATPNAEITFDTTKQKVYNDETKLIGTGDYVQMVQFLDGLRIHDYKGQEKYLRFNGDTDFSKIAKVSIGDAWQSGSYYYQTITLELVDGGVLYIDIKESSGQGGSSTHNGSIFVGDLDGDGTKNLVFANNGKTGQVGQTWIMPRYEFKGNNGVSVKVSLNPFGSTNNYEDDISKPSAKFGTTISATVTFDANGGNSAQALAYATSVATSVTLPSPTRSGYIFAGWYTAASGGTKVGGAGESYTPSANITLYAHWGQPCTVTYNANGGSCGTSSEKYTGTALTLPTPTRDGYWFIGWYDAAEGGNKIGDAGVIYNPIKEITLYAHWQKAIEYTVSYNANGGSCGTASATYEGTALTLPTPTRMGYTFNGWYDAASGGSKVEDAGATYIPSADITLYAQWTINSYTVTVTTINATVKVNGTQVSNNDTVSIQYGTQVTVEVTYSGDDNKSTTIKGTDGTTYTSPFTMPAQNVTINATSSCVTPDTLITLANGKQVRVDSLTGKEELLVWNLETGKYDTAPIVFVDTDEETEYEVIHLYFSDGSDVKVISEHGFFDLDLGKYVYIDAENYADYVGHRFVTEGDVAANKWNIVTLDKVVLEKEVTTAWSPVTFEHLCYYTNGVLSMPGGIEGLFNIFEVNTNTMRYDAKQMQEDIETYGLFTLEDFGGMISEEAFQAFNGAYLKVAMGKGLLTWEDIAYMAERYIPLM